MADRQISELDPVKESAIGGLPGVLEIYDDTLIPVEQTGTAMHMTGQQFREFGEATSKQFVQTAKDAATAAVASAKTAEQHKNAANTAQTAAKAAQTAAETASKAAAASATKAQSYAEGGTGTRAGENADNAQYYYEQAKRISQGLSGALQPMGTIKFAALPSSAVAGWLYNISDAFTTTSAFVEGAGHAYPAGTNVYRTAENKWDCLAGTQVVSVNSKTGAVVLAAKDVGALPTTGGTLTGPVSVNADTVGGSNKAYIGVKHNTGGTYVSLTSGADGDVGVYSSTLNTWLVHMNADKTYTVGGQSGPFLRSAANTVATTNIANGAVTKEKIATGVLTAANVGALPITGGMVTGDLNAGERLRLYTSTEGGNIRITPPDDRQTTNKYWEIDAYNGNIRIYANTAAGTNVAALTLNSTAAGTQLNGNAATATKLATARTINGEAFDGTKAITVKDSTKLPLTGGTVTGPISVKADTVSGTNNAYIGVQNTTGGTYVSLTSSADGSVSVYSSTKSKALISMNAQGTVFFDGVAGPFLQKTANSVATTNIAANAVTEAKIANGAVTLSKLAMLATPNDTIGTRLIDDGSSDAAKFNTVGSGLFRWTSALTDGNKPFPTGVGICIKQSDSAAVQLAFATTVATPKFVIRRKKSGTWENWKEITISASDFEKVTSDEPMPGPGFGDAGDVDGPSADAETEAKNEQDSESV